MKSYSCSTCKQHFVNKAYPQCSEKRVRSLKMIALPLLLGLVSSAGGEKENAGDSNTEEPSAELEMSALYGEKKG